ncbi:monovalent cation:proton antiporter-2 (CPA2) family protein [Chitinimonas lacunae]|uniref:Monovalent cation:proton antiporter-2 (CPA2) family protein n=1 Tax=Chitinimonas lacunae TaxID=1963018 RepID=A0ABV8MU50_9NEIS
MSLLSQSVVLLAAAVIAVPLFKRFGLASVLGYLAAGVAIGPWGAKLIEAPEAILHVTEFGVVLLLFVIGLELQPARLWVLRRAVFGLGGAQVLLSAVPLALLAAWLGMSPLSAGVVGLVLALSSTAFVLQMLTEKNQMATRHGRDAFSVLLFQDLAVIPLLALLPVIAPDAGARSGPPWWVAATVVIGTVLAGHWLLRPALKRVAEAGSQEIFTMAALLVVTGMAWAMQAVGLSLSLGAFLAGVLLAESEYRHEIEASIEPFKGVLLGLFFVAVGMSANLGVLLERPLVVLGVAVGLMAIKAIALYVIGRSAGLDERSARRLAVFLAQGGEFAFVLFAVATDYRLIGPAHADLLTMAVTLSMALTPLLVLAHEKWLVPRLEAQAERAFDTIAESHPRVVVAGFGRFGQIVVRLLHAQGLGATVLDASPEQVDFVRRFGNKVYYGDASRLDLLRAAGTEHAEVFVLAIDHIETSLKTAELVRRHFPQVKVYARARNRFHYYRLIDLGVEVAERETFLASLDLAGHVLCGLGLDPQRAAAATAAFRRHDEALLTKQQAVFHDEVQLLQTTRDALQELEGLFESDRRDERRRENPPPQPETPGN